MKKILFIAVFFTAFFPMKAQETAERRNDIMISPIELIAGPALNISYERLLSESSGIGINFATVFSGDDSVDGIKTQISPFYRMYFGKKYAAGFFVEGFAPITMSNDTNFDKYYYDTYQSPGFGEEKHTTVGLGFGFGGKWVARKNILFEASFGIARRFGSGNFDKVTGKGMLGIGYRF